MKAAGIIRKIDDLGRVVIPKDVRRALEFNVGESIEVTVKDKEIILTHGDGSNGETRTVDSLGRIVIPKSARKVLSIDKQDNLEIFTDDKSLILKKYSIKCCFCGESEEIHVFMSDKICTSCLRKLKKIAV